MTVVGMETWSSLCLVFHMPVCTMERMHTSQEPHSGISSMLSTTPQATLTTSLMDRFCIVINVQLSHDALLPPPSSSTLTVSLKQLIVGSRGSGSPPHFHRHVFNALVYGVKRWFLWPSYIFPLCVSSRAGLVCRLAVLGRLWSVYRGQEMCSIHLITGGTL